MKIDVALTPGTFRHGSGDGKSVIVVDVLRASTTIITALANGGEKIIPFATVEDVRESAKAYSRDRVLLCGERQSVRIPGFDLGNSPREYDDSVVQGKILLFTSTNGSQMLIKATGAAEVNIAGFVNIGSVVERLIQKKRDCVIACAGHEGGFSLEDGVCAGMIVSEAKQGRTGGSIRLSDEALAAAILYEHFANDLQGMIKKSFWGEYLTRIGLGDDLPLCASVNSYDLVPVLQNGVLVKKKLDLNYG